MTHIWSWLCEKGSSRHLRHISIMWFLTSGTEKRTAPLNLKKKKSDEWSLRNKRVRVEKWPLELLPEKHSSLKIWSLHPSLSNMPWSQLSDSEWPMSVSSLDFQSLISHSRSQKTYSQVTESIPSPLGLRMLPLKLPIKDQLWLLYFISLHSSPVARSTS